MKTLADAISAQFQRIQFTPDLLPADLIGTMIYNPQTGEFTVRKGPIFANIVLADEINRAPAKVQSRAARGDAGAPGHDRRRDATRCPSPFLVLATQNPIEQEGTYPLPEAQVDRFMLKVKVGYPTREEERQIMDRMAGGTAPRAPAGRRRPEQIAQRPRRASTQIYVDDKVKDYIVDIVFATREPERVRPRRTSATASSTAPRPRATICLDARRARRTPSSRHRGYVTPEDVKAIGLDVLRHRVIAHLRGRGRGAHAARRSSSGSSTRVEVP